MPDLFRQGARSPVSDSGDVESSNLTSATTPGFPQAESSASGATPQAFSRANFGSKGVFKQDKVAATLKGRDKRGQDPRKWRYDTVRGASAALPFETSRDDRMSAVEAGEMLHKLHVIFGIATEVEGVLRAFDRALFFSHTVNGGSTLVPGRSTFSIPGMTQEFSYAVVRDMLGDSQRRFFRAYADDITAVNKEILRDYDPYDHVKAEQWGWLQQVAYERGLNRHPHLAHDSADACLELSPVERAALAASKTMVISTTNNSADRLKANNRVSSADGYDSTVGERN